MNSTVPATSRVSPFLVAMLLIALFLSMFSIYYGIEQYVSTTGDPSQGSLYIAVGTGLMVLSGYMLFQTRRRMLKIVSPEMLPLSTTLTCQKCGLRNVRDFQRGDFVFKQTDQACPKDNEKMVISAIYREIKDTEKTKESVFS